MYIKYPPASNPEDNDGFDLVLDLEVAVTKVVACVIVPILSKTHVEMERMIGTFVTSAMIFFVSCIFLAKDRRVKLE